LHLHPIDASFFYMTALLAMGIPNTTDDWGYLQWLSQNWTLLIVPTVAFSALLIACAVRFIRAWTAATPGSSDGAGTQSKSMDIPLPPGHPSSDQAKVEWPFDLLPASSPHL
jgi:hypothetical protein